MFFFGGGYVKGVFGISLLVFGLMFLGSDLLVLDKGFMGFFVIRCRVVVCFLGINVEIVVVNVWVSMYVLLLFFESMFSFMISIFGYGFKVKL